MAILNYRLNYPDPEFLMQVAEGKLSGYDYIDKFGENPEIDEGSQGDIWSQGGFYTFSTSADIDRIVSSNDSDNQKIRIFGLDENYKKVSEVITLQGQTPVSLSNTYLRVFRMMNIGNTDIAGTVYCFVNSNVTSGVPDDATKIRAIIDDGANQTEMAIYTVPAGEKLYLFQTYATLSRVRNTSAVITLRVRPQGGVFQVKRRVLLQSNGASQWHLDYNVPLIIDEKSDILFRCEKVSGDNAAIAAGMIGILKEK